MQRAWLPSLSTSEGRAATTLRSWKSRRTLRGGPKDSAPSGRIVVADRAVLRREYVLPVRRNAAVLENRLCPEVAYDLPHLAQRQMRRGLRHFGGHGPTCPPRCR